MSAFVICTECGRGGQYGDEHGARNDGWEDLSIDGVVGPGNESEWAGHCPECSD